jgi:signal transduction histidine kinase
MNKLLKKIGFEKNGMARIIAKRFMLLFLVFALLIIITIPTALFLNLVSERGRDAQNTRERIENMRPSLPFPFDLGNENDRIFPFTEGGTERDYFNENAVRIFGNIYKIEDRGYYYLQKGIRNGEDFEVFISLNETIGTSGLVLIIVLIVMAVIFIAGLIGVAFLSKKIARPYSSLAKEAEEKTGFSDAMLTVPDAPIEAEAVAKSFNKLLGTLNEKMETEKSFFQNAAHELKTPIAGISGHIGLIERRGEQHPEVVKESLGQIDISARRMSKTVEQLLQMSSYDEIKELPKEEINLKDCIEEILLEMTIPQKIIVNDYDEKIFVNKEQFKSMLTELITNASKYSAEKSEIKIVINKNRLSIIDEGKGISKKAKKHIFDRFYREDSSHSSKIPGTGLGLSIVKMIADMNNIKIEVRDNHPKGSIFLLRFSH